MVYCDFFIERKVMKEVTNIEKLLPQTLLNKQGRQNKQYKLLLDKCTAQHISRSNTNLINYNFDVKKQTKTNVL